MEKSLEKKELFSNKALTKLIVPLLIEQTLAVAVGMVAVLALGAVLTLKKKED